MRVAFSNLACPDWSLGQAVAAAREWGYEGVELRLLNGEVIPLALPPEHQAMIRETLERAGLSLVAFDTSIRLVGDEDESAVCEAIRAALTLAKTLGAPVIRVFGGPFAPEQAWEAVRARAARILNRATPWAEETGVAIALETHDSFASGERVAAVLDMVPSRAVGALWDTLHPFRVGETPDTTMRLLGDRLMLVHIKDARVDGPAWELCLLGEGNVPVRAVLGLLAQHGYRGWLSVEWEKRWHPELADPAVALPQHVQVLREWLAAIGQERREAE